MFTGLILSFTVIILVVRSKLMSSDDVSILINDKKSITTPVGKKLLDTLADAGLHLPAACGGKGTCAQCKASVLDGGGAVLPVEQALLSKKELSHQIRLACQLVVRDDMRVNVPEEIFGVKQWQCTVRSTKSVSTFIKEIVLELPAGETIEFRAGEYIVVDCPPYQIEFKDFDIDPVYQKDWGRFDLWRHRVNNKETTARAYSLANYPEENNIIILDIRIAVPPPGADPSVPPGIVSSYLFGLKPGDNVAISGPYGHFLAKETDNEMVFVAGGTGMAGMRSHIFDQLLRIKTKRKISFWYGARTQNEIFYQEDFDKLEATHDNFQWHIALSEITDEDEWEGYTGFIHQILHDHYLADHPAPEDCEYYLCGPPLMNNAVTHMLDDLGVEASNIFVDEY